MLPSEQREPALRALGLSAPLIEEVLALAEAADARTSQATRALRPIGQLLFESAAAELALGSRLGSWEIKAQIGQGGMGRVYLAERADGHFEQRTAIKVLAGLATGNALERLTQERQILAKLSHPNIA